MCQKNAIFFPSGNDPSCLKEKSVEFTQGTELFVLKDIL